MHTFDYIFVQFYFKTLITNKVIALSVMVSFKLVNTR